MIFSNSPFVKDAPVPFSAARLRLLLLKMKHNHVEVRPTSRLDQRGQSVWSAALSALPNTGAPATRALSSFNYRKYILFIIFSQLYLNVKNIFSWHPPDLFAFMFFFFFLIYGFGLR